MQTQIADKSIKMHWCTVLLININISVLTYRLLNSNIIKPTSTTLILNCTARTTLTLDGNSENNVLVPTVNLLYIYIYITKMFALVCISRSNSLHWPCSIQRQFISAPLSRCAKSLMRVVTNPPTIFWSIHDHHSVCVVTIIA